MRRPLLRAALCAVALGAGSAGLRGGESQPGHEDEKTAERTDFAF